MHIVIQQSLLKLTSNKTNTPPSKPVAVYLRSEGDVGLLAVEYPSLLIANPLLYKLTEPPSSVSNPDSMLEIQHAITATTWAYKFATPVSLDGQVLYKYVPAEA